MAVGPNTPFGPSWSFDLVTTDDLHVTDDLTVDDDITLANGSVLTWGTTNPVVISKSADTLTLAASDTLAITTADKFTVGGVIVPQYFVVNHLFSLFTDMVDGSIFIAHRACKLVAAYEVHKTAESGGTVKINLTRQQSTEAPASGDGLLSNNTNTGFDGVATAETLQTGVVITTAAVNEFAVGNRLGVDFQTDTPGELAGCLITAVFQCI